MTFAHDITEHQLTGGIISEQFGDVIPGTSAFLGAKLGVNRIAVHSLHASLLNFATPADIKAIFFGGIIDLDLGIQYQLPNTPIYIGGATNIGYSYSVLNRITTQPEDGQYNADVKIRTFNTGLKLIVAIRLSDAEVKKLSIVK